MKSLGAAVVVLMAVTPALGSASAQTPTRDQAEQVAARVNAQLASNEPTLLTFTPIGVAELRKQFLDYHEHTLGSSVATVRTR